MRPSNATSEQRQSFRCPVPDSRQTCAVRVGEDIYPGKLFDESAGGFSAVVEGPLELQVRQTAVLETDAGWFRVRVMHIQELPPPAVEASDNAEEPPEEPPPRYRLGLLRLDELPPQPPSVSVLAPTLRSRLGQWAPSGGLLPSLSVLFMLGAMVLVPVGIALMIWYVKESGRVDATADQDSAREWTPREPPAAKPSRAEGFDSREPGPPVSESDQNGRQSGKGRSWIPALTAQERKASESIRHLSGVAAMLVPEVVRFLSLTPEQQTRLQQLEDATAEAMRRFPLNSGLQGPERQHNAEQRQKLLDDAHLQAMGFLTQEQRARWTKIADEPPPPSK